MAATRTRNRTRLVVRLRAAPPLDPPYDDELTLVSWLRGTGDQLELDLHGAGRSRGSRISSHPARTVAPAPRTAVGPAAGPAPAPGAAPAVGPAPTAGAVPTAGPVPMTSPMPAAALATATAETRQAARRFLDAVLEMFNGYRPVAHARALTTPGLAADLVDQLRAAVDRLPGTARPGQPAGHRIRLLSLRVCEPAPGVAEAAAAIGNDEHTWALAFRLERQRSRWIAALARLL